MTLPRLTAAASADDVATALAESGCAVVERLLPDASRERVLAELEPWMRETPVGPDDFSGRRTRRTGALVARSPSSRELVAHPLVLDVVRRVLSHVAGFQLHLTQMIAIGPGEPAQPIHRDQWAFDFFPFPTGYEVQCNTIWAMCDFTEENGATRLVPGSHRREDGLAFQPSDTIPATMPAGSVLLYTGSLYHGAGANRSETTRCGLNLTYSASWLRQEENQYLSVPAEVARTLPEDLLRLLGYARGAYALGYVDDMRDPLDALFGRAGATVDVGLGDLASVSGRAGTRVPPDGAD